MTKVSVIIPTYNSSRFIKETLQSITRQTHTVHEVIIVDDGSEDNTVNIIKNQSLNLPIRLVQQPHKGDPAYGRNVGVSMAKGDFIAFLDHDDVWPTNKIAVQHKILTLHKKVDLVVGKTQIFRFKKNSGFLNKEYFLKPKFNLLLSAALIRRKLFDKVGYFNENLKYWGSDGDWFLRLWEQEVCYHFHDEIALFWQYHHKNTSRDKSERDLVIAEILKKSLDRRRKNFSDIKDLPPLNIF